MASLAISPAHEHSQFLQALPHLVHYASYRFRGLPPCDREEAVAETVAAGFQLSTGLAKRGRTEIVGKPGFLSNAVCHVLSDRHVGGSASSTDVHSRLARQRRGFHLQSFYLPTSDASWRDLAVEDRRCGPAEMAAFKVDFETWLKGQSRRNRCIIDLLAAGEKASAIADRFGISQPRVCQLRRHLQENWLAFQGEPTATSA